MEMKPLFEWLWCKVGLDTVLGFGQRGYWVGVVIEVEETVAGPLFRISDGKVVAELNNGRIARNSINPRWRTRGRDLRVKFLNLEQGRGQRPSLSPNIAL
ncbi:hypothetical protein Acr_03g0011390 [Actinidia rufa]|uniref:Uncharacterized protein n=1 Tax=Actinidia rufa TaxID=165716 RepID=A0A7J0ED53_9ERIC|nr:hypothetical protein Acr_03g0011390 [Actinidia rufa]